MTTPDRTISVLRLFTLERPAWTVEEAAAALCVSASSAYRYFAALSEAGLLATETTGRYVLGPAIIQYDRQIQLTDPLLRASRPVMSELAGFAPDSTTLLLCRLFGETIMCVHQVLGRGPQPLVSYERGRPMPLLRGATSKVILPYLPARDLRRLHDAHAAEIQAAGLGANWPGFRAALAQIRKTGVVVSHQEVDTGRVGIAAPLFSADRRVLGSLSFIAMQANVDPPRISRLASLIVAGAREIEAIQANTQPDTLAGTGT